MLLHIQEEWYTTALNKNWEFFGSLVLMRFIDTSHIIVDLS